MEKIPTMYERDWEGDRSRVTSDIHPGCEWIIAGEGTPTRKFDGTCVMFDGEKWWARREVKDGKPTPPGFISSGHDHVTLKNVGWEPIDQSSFAKFAREALDRPKDSPFAPGTYELCGPKVQGNPEGFAAHVLIEHATAEEVHVEHRDFQGIEDALAKQDIEGIVFHHQDGRMAKIKKRDFGLKRKPS
jgi:hypothetical protein